MFCFFVQHLLSIDLSQGPFEVGIKFLPSLVIQYVRNLPTLMVTQSGLLGSDGAGVRIQCSELFENAVPVINLSLPNGFCPTELRFWGVLGSLGALFLFLILFVAPTSDPVARII